MVWMLANDGQRFYISNEEALLSDLFAAVMSDNEDDDEIPVVGLSPQHVAQSMCMLQSLHANRHAWYFKDVADSTLAALCVECLPHMKTAQSLPMHTQIAHAKHVLLIADYLAIIPAVNMAHGFIRHTLARAQTVDDVVDMMFSAEEFATLAPAQQHTICDSIARTVPLGV